MSKQAVVLLSGGLDSTVALWWAMERGWSCQALSFDYGQRHNKELKNAKAIAALAGIQHHVVEFKLPWSQSSLTSKSAVLPRNKINKPMPAIPSTYVPGRNTIFLSFALSLVDEILAEAIVIGANAIDYSGYPDCREPYLKAFQKTASLGSRQGSENHLSLSILAPLVHLTKADIIRLGLKMGAPLHLTWSCYKGLSRPCERCDSCQFRAKGFQDVGRPDPALS
jgi:7-cyano-7-deazaguanine synthase